VIHFPQEILHVPRCHHENLDEDDLPVSGFSIVTQKNERITADQIRLQTTAKVTKQDNSVSHNSVWEAMDTYFDDLSQGHLLER